MYKMYHDGIVNQMPFPQNTTELWLTFKMILFSTPCTQCTQFIESMICKKRKTIYKQFTCALVEEELRE